MASTAAGRLLTDEHRKAQVLLSVPLVESSKQIWDSLLSLDDLDGSSNLWASVQLESMRSSYGRSQALAEPYISEYRFAEIGQRSGFIATPSFNAAGAAVTLRVAGPIAVKSFIKRGYAPDQAYRMARDGFAGRAQEWALRGGRATVMQTGKGDRRAIGSRRVSDGNPCAFCAMLVVRDLESYRRVANNDFKAHAHCGCTEELIYGENDHSDEEVDWIDSYRQAADEARAAGETVRAPSRRSKQDTVLWRMRRNQPHLFHDGILAP